MSRYESVEAAIEALVSRALSRWSGGDGCWEMNKNLDRDGYGRMIITTPVRKNIRIARAVVSVREGLPYTSWDWVTCHQCDNPPCIRPDHLTRGSYSRNNTETYHRGGKSDRVTHCANGHEFTEENTYWWLEDEQRQCKTCRRDNARRYRADKRYADQPYWKG